MITSRSRDIYTTSSVCRVSYQSFWTRRRRRRRRQMSPCERVRPSVSPSVNLYRASPLVRLSVRASAEAATSSEPPRGGGDDDLSVGSFWCCYSSGGGGGGGGGASAAMEQQRVVSKIPSVWAVVGRVGSAIWLAIGLDRARNRTCPAIINADRLAADSITSTSRQSDTRWLHPEPGGHSLFHRFRLRSPRSAHCPAAGFFVPVGPSAGPTTHSSSWLRRRLRRRGRRRLTTAMVGPTWRLQLAEQDKEDQSAGLRPNSDKTCALPWST